MTAARKTIFRSGDVVTVKGQSAILTVVPPIRNQAGETVSRDGWTWCVHCATTGVGFHLLPNEVLVRKARQ